MFSSYYLVILFTLFHTINHVVY